jgi:hypothetical protein
VNAGVSIPEPWAERLKGITPAYSHGARDKAPDLGALELGETWKFEQPGPRWGSRKDIPSRPSFPKSFDPSWAGFGNYELGQKSGRPEKPPKTERQVPEQPERSEAEIAAEKADRVLKMGRDAERMGQRDAAKSFYRKVIKEYPDTEAAKRAAERLKELGG